MGSHWRSIWTFAILAIAAGPVSGCAYIAEHDPTARWLLTLLEDIESARAPTVTNINIVNGAGETLYDGPRPSDGKIAANPTPEQLDGKMTITRTYSDGSTRQQALTYEAGKPVNIGYSSASNDYYIEPSPKPTGMPRFYGGFESGFEWVNRPDTEIVRQDQGGQLAGFVKADNESSNPGFSGRVGFKMDQPLFGLGRKWGLEVRGSYYSSTSREHINVVRNNGGDLAILGPLPGGGLNLGMNDITDLRYSSDYTTWSVQPRFNKSYGIGTLYGKPVHMNSYVGFNYGKNEDDEELSGSVPGAGVDFMTGSWIDNWYYGPEFGFDAAWYWCPPVKLKLGGFVNVNVNDLKAKRMLVATGFSGADEFSNTEVTVGGGARVGLNYKWNNYFSAKVGFEYEYANDTPVVNVDPQTGDASVGAEGADIYRIVVGARVNF